MSKRDNPYKRGNYNLIMAFIMSFLGKPFTKSQVISHAMDELDMDEAPAKASVGVVLGDGFLKGIRRCGGQVPPSR